jgi:uncharacterized membrane protein
MPNIGFAHPYVVHFVIGLLVVGVVFRVLSLTGKMPWTNQAAAALILLGTIAAVIGVRSGDDAHGPVERIPGARNAVVEHEEWGERTRNLFLAVSALEVGALLAGGPRRRWVQLGAAALGAVGLFFVYETAEHGGAIVYEYAGGPGLRTGNPEDVHRLLLAGLYHQAMLDRKNGNADGAASLVREMVGRWPSDTNVRLLAIESTLRDGKNPAAALAALDTMRTDGDARLTARVNGLRVDALLAAGMKDSAVAVLRRMLEASPGNARLRARLDSLQ